MATRKKAEQDPHAAAIFDAVKDAVAVGARRNTARQVLETLYEDLRKRAAVLRHQEDELRRGYERLGIAEFGLPARIFEEPEDIDPEDEDDE